MSETKRRIAFLDDRPATAETVVNGLAPLMPKGWEIITCPMQADPTKYAPWISKNNVLVFIVDQLLNEHPVIGGAPVAYKGHNVLAELRKQLPELPIVVATRATEEPELLQHLGDADEIVSRTALVDNGAQYIIRFVRLGQKFLDVHEQDLNELSTLSVKAAAGHITGDEESRLRSIQAKLNLVNIDHPLDEVLKGLEKEVKQLEQLHDKARQFVDARSKSERKAVRRKRKNK